MATMNISMPDTMRNWVEAQCDSGLYANNSDYIRDLIRRDQLSKQANLLNFNQAERQRMQLAIDAGVNSGEAETFQLDNFLTDMQNKHLKNNANNQP